MELGRLFGRRVYFEPRWGLGLKLALFESGYSLDVCPVWGKWLVPLPFRPKRLPEELMESWGASLYDRSIYLNWGAKYKFVRLPWDFEHVRHEVLRPDGTWVPYVGCWEHGKEPDGRQTWTAPYSYKLKRGEVQERTATVYVEEREWRWRWFTWLPWPRIIRRSIAVRFSDEVGERTGSWKGGTIGCGYEMKPGEQPLETLRRMERERIFD